MWNIESDESRIGNLEKGEGKRKKWGGDDKEV